MTTTAAANGDYRTAAMRGPMVQAVAIADVFEIPSPQPAFGCACACRDCEREPIAVVVVESKRDGRRRELGYCRGHALAHLELFGPRHPVLWFDVCSLRHCDRLAAARLRGSRPGDHERDLFVFVCGWHESVVRPLWRARLVERLTLGVSS